MSGINVAKNYGDVQSLVKAHQDSLFEVNSDGSIRTQNIKEKIANIGARIFGKFDARKAEKDARVKDAILLFYNKTGQSATSVYAPQRDRILQDRFFNPVPLPSRSALKDHKPTTASVFLQARDEKYQDPSINVKAHQQFYRELNATLQGLADTPAFEADKQQILDLTRVLNRVSNHVDPENAAQGLNQLKEDLKPIGLRLGVEPLHDFNVSQGVLAWAKENLPNQF
jgi:hypothetical protein